MYSLTTTILTLPKIIGCEEFPKSEHGKMLIEDIDRFINDHYRYNGKQVMDAFELAATHSLFLDGKRVDPSTFGKFLSRASVGKILTAYKESKQREKAAPRRTNYMLSSPIDKITPEEAFELCVEKSQSEDPQLHWLPLNLAYTHMIKQGMIKAVEKKKAYIPVKFLKQKHRIESDTQRIAVIEYFTL